MECNYQISLQKKTYKTPTSLAYVHLSPKHFGVLSLVVELATFSSLFSFNPWLTISQNGKISAVQAILVVQFYLQNLPYNHKCIYPWSLPLRGGDFSLQNLPCNHKCTYPWSLLPLRDRSYCEGFWYTVIEMVRFGHRTCYYCKYGSTLLYVQLGACKCKHEYCRHTE